MPETTDEASQQASATAESYTGLQWREDPPTEEGYYWVRYAKHVPGYVTVSEGAPVCEVVDTPTGLRVRNEGFPHVEEMENREWAGPIPEPETKNRDGQSEGDRHEGDDVAALRKEAKEHLAGDPDDRVEIERWAHLRAEDREYGINLYAIIADIEAKGWLWEVSVQPGGTFYEAGIWTDERKYMVREQDTAAVALEVVFEEALAVEEAEQKAPSEAESHVDEDGPVAKALIEMHHAADYLEERKNQLSAARMRRLADEAADAVGMEIHEST